MHAFVTGKTKLNLLFRGNKRVRRETLAMTGLNAAQISIGE